MVKQSDKRVTCSKPCRSELIRRKTLGLNNLNRPNSGVYDNIWFDSSWEVAFYIWAKDNIFGINRNKQVFVFDDMKYVPDFFDGKIYYEVKGSPYYSNLDLKIAKMKEIGLNVHVIDQVAIKPIIQYVKTKYKVQNIRDLYIERDNNKLCRHCQTVFKCDRAQQAYCGKSCALSARHLAKKFTCDPGT